MNAKSKKIFLLSSMGLITASTLAVLLIGQSQNIVLDSTGNETNRTLTINSSNRKLDYYQNGKQYYSGALIQLQDQAAYHRIDIGQSQQSVFDHHDNCILATWGNVSGGNGCYFSINATSSDTFSLDKDMTKPYTMVNFRQLTRVDITLDKGDGTDRYTSLVSKVGGVETGVFTELEDASTYIKYKWTPNNEGYITSDQYVKFAPSEGSLGEAKAIWLTELKIYYTC